MQKFKIARWPKYNPAGDVLITKLVWSTTWGTQLASPLFTQAGPAVGSVPFLMTDIYEILNSTLWTGTSHPRSSASLQAAVLFRSFRVTGMKLSWQSTCVGVGGAGTNVGQQQIAANSPYKFCVVAGGQNDGTASSLPINVWITPEQRWQICRDVDAPATTKKWHSIYFSVAKLIGQPYNKTDSVYSGQTDNSSPSGFGALAGQRPLLGPWWRFGITTATGTANTATYDPSFITQMKFIFYVTYFDKISNATQ